MKLQLSATVVDAPDPRELGYFYSRLLGWEIAFAADDWVMLKAPDGGAALSFQAEPNYVRPVWPAGQGDHPMMMHLDIHVDDLDHAGAYAQELGAELAEFQPQERVRVYLDPAGHPFCLFLD